MKINIRHETRYTYDDPITHAVQRLALTPPNFPGQTVLEWSIEVPGIEAAPEYPDGFGNIVRLCSQTGLEGELLIVASGIVETSDRNGIVGALPGEPPTRIYLRRTPLTKTSEGMETAAHSMAAETSDDIERMHRLMAYLKERMRFETEATDARTSARDAFAAGHGVCQDFTHVFIAIARYLGLPARYVTGYLLLENEDRAEAQHAWAEVWLPALGWVGFDATNNVCPTERYVRLCCGLDADSAAPVRGLRMGRGSEALSVLVDVQQVDQ